MRAEARRTISRRRARIVGDVWGGDGLNPIAIDFETYYSADYSVSKMGYHAYTHHPKFDPYLVGFADAAGTWAGEPPAADWSRVHGRDVLAHNANFDRAVFDALQERGKIPAYVRPARWLCTCNLARFCQCPASLADAANAILGRTLDKTSRAKAVGSAKGGFFMAEYCIADAQACFDLWQAAGKYWPEPEQRLSALTAEIGRRGMALDLDYLRDQNKRLLMILGPALAAIPWAKTDAPASPKALRAACEAAGIPAPSSTDCDSPVFLDWLEANAHGPAAPWIKAVQSWRSANRAEKVLHAMQARQIPGGRIESHLTYFGAATGRWSGGGGFNLQNLNSSADLCDMRGCLVAPRGNRLLVIDLAQIEARVLLWLVGDRGALEMIRQGASVYEAHARATMAWKGGPLKAENPGLYKLAKARVLGLGYGCGPAKFVTVAKIMAGLDLTPAEAAKTVKEYRAANPGIVGLWARLGKAFDATPPGANYRLALPSGRSILYRNCRPDHGTAEKIKGRTSKVYGGLLCEKMIQAPAGDVFAERLLALEAAGFRTVLLVHDEYVLEVDEAGAADALQAAMAIIRTPPAWAEGLPIDCEGRVLERYTK